MKPPTSKCRWMLAVIGVFATLAVLPTAARAVTLDEVRGAVPNGLVERDTAVYRVVPVTADTYARTREYWALPGRQIMVIKYGNNTMIDYKLFRNDPWPSFGNQFEGIYPLESLYYLGDRFFGLVNIAAWTDTNTTASEIQRDGRQVWQVVRSIAEPVRTIVWFDPTTGVPLGWQRWRDGVLRNEYRIELVVPIPAAPAVLWQTLKKGAEE